ncbi:MAG: thioredoxin family protein [Bacteroidota bacterium]
MDRAELLRRIKNKGMTFEKFNDLADTKIRETDESKLDNEAKRKFGFTQLNQRRTYRILKTYKVNEKIEKAISKIIQTQTWMILTEDWCGDSAQNLPYIYKYSELNDNIELKILNRESNLDIMDKYLTNGVRAIPMFIAFDENGNELFEWGPRPEEAKELVAKWKAEGDTKDQFNEKLHLWYGRNRGKDFEKEFLRLLDREA